ncbi:MAG: PIN domain-containing protein [Chthonomonadetes bacterium]|nr:PIN domain-containing protein [Chthonomonadetes bacterium]
MNGKYLVDTSVLVDLLRGTRAVALPDQSELIVCVIAVGELYYGALIANRSGHRVQQLMQFLSRYSILHTSDGVSAAYAELKCALKERGTPIPENDVWIAAFAKTYQLPLLTRDSHFQHIAALGVEVIYV